MVVERSLAFVALASSLTLGCGDPAGATGDPLDPDPVFSADERAALQGLRYSDAAPPADPSNRFSADEAAAHFGRRLFFDGGLSGPLLEADNDGTPGTLGLQGEAGRVSCASCHVPQAGFVDARSPHRQISLAAMWTRRRTPTLLESGFVSLFNWDGRRDSLWSQAIGVMESEREFNGGRLLVARQIQSLHAAEYEALFGPLPPLAETARFPELSPEAAGCVERLTRDGSIFECRGKPGDGADYDGMAPADQDLVTEVTVNAAKALAAYVAKLRCGPGRFDAWLDGDATALTRSEQRGAALFVGEAGCVGCHAGPNLTDGAFHNVGLAPAPVAVAFVDSGDRGAAEGIAALAGDPLSSLGPFSDGDRGVVPDSIGPELEGAFRTPTLRCASSQPSFMHTGQLGTLEQVVAFFVRGGDGAGAYPGTSEIHALSLDERERADLVAFVGALAGPGPDEELLSAP